MSDNTPRTGLPLLAAAQAQKHVTHNEALLQLDALMFAPLLDRDLAAPPIAPDNGDTYLVAASASGAWVGQSGKLAYADGGAWRFYAPFAGLTTYVADEMKLIVFDGDAWVEYSSLSAMQDIPLLGVNATADATNKFSVRSNAVLFAGLENSEGGTGDLQCVVNKEAAGDTGSLLFQTGYSTRAELGLTGDDNLHVKVSPDGSTWHEAFQIDRSSGLASLQGDPVAALGAATRQYVDVLADAFLKADGGSAAFIKTGAGTISLKAGARIGMGGNTIYFASETAVTMPSLTAGTDYAIYICHDGTLRADADFSAPSGYTTSNSRKIGGFHYAPGGNASGTSGGDTTPAINPYSIWDLKWRPACSDPRGMALVAGNFWCDIYLCNTAPEENGTSGYNLTIADGSSPPKIPTDFGGDGSTAYGGFSWWEASEVMFAAGKKLLSYAEFAAAMYGTTEGVSYGSDPVTTLLRNAYTSRWGIMLATGNMLVWGSDFSYFPGAGSAGWKDQTQSRGKMYLSNDIGLVAAIFGGHWNHNENSGSRASGWYTNLWSSDNVIAARGSCNHLRCG